MYLECTTAFKNKDYCCSFLSLFNQIYLAFNISHLKEMEENLCVLWSLTRCPYHTFRYCMNAASTWNRTLHITSWLYFSVCGYHLIFFGNLLEFFHGFHQIFHFTAQNWWVSPISERARAQSFPIWSILGWKSLIKSKKIFL